MFGKILRRVVRQVLPREKWIAYDNKISDSENIIKGNIVLYVLIKLILFPVALAVSLLKLILVWILPVDWGEFKYIIMQFYDDVFIKKTGREKAVIRAKLILELFTKGAEHYITCGDKNPDKTFYVLRPYYFMTRNELIINVSNLLMHYYRNLHNLAYAIENGWIPVVDWQNYGPLPHEEEYPIHGTTNSWEYYWNQPSKYTLEEVYQSKNVILSTRNTRNTEYMPSCFFSGSMQELAERLALECPRYDKYITFNDVTEKYIDEWQSKLFPKGARILGVSVRGTSYGVDKASTNICGHPVQPSVEQLIISINKAMEEWEMEYLFITCELDSIIEAVSSYFKDKTIVLRRLRYSKAPQRGDVEKGLDPLYLPGQKYQTNLDYLTEMALLSRCSSLLAAMSSGVRAALIWNGNRYEKVRIIDNGLW